jgi:hypothetical protein
MEELIRRENLKNASAKNQTVTNPSNKNTCKPISTVVSSKEDRRKPKPKSGRKSKE